MKQVLAIVAMALALAACGQSDAQKAKKEFDAKCKATPTLQECKDWKDQTTGGDAGGK